MSGESTPGPEPVAMSHPCQCREKSWTGAAAGCSWNWHCHRCGKSWETVNGMVMQRIPAPSLADENAALKAEVGRLRDIIDEASEHPGEAYMNGLDCGVEDRDITDRYEAARYGWGECLEYIRSVLANTDAARAALAPKEEPTP